MRAIPTIGGVGGIFEVFVPGLFLLLNLIIVLYFLPFYDQETREQILAVVSNPAVTLIIAIGFGYLMGVIFRIFRVDTPDKWSGRYLQVFDKNCKNGESRSNLYAFQPFPYKGWLAVVCQRSMPAEVLDFYYDTWAHFKITDRTLKGYMNEENPEHQIPEHFIEKLKELDGRIFKTRTDFLADLEKILNKEDLHNYESQILRYACLWIGKASSFFNFCKAMVISNDERISNEIYSRASLSRYISGMFYALFLASLLILITFSFHLVVNGQIVSILVILLLLYFLALWAILKNLRFMRISEVQTLFYASFKNRDLFNYLAREVD